MGYNCDPTNDPSENKLPSSIYGLLGLEGMKKGRSTRQPSCISFVNSLSKYLGRRTRSDSLSFRDVDRDPRCLYDAVAQGMLFCPRLILIGRYRRMNFGDSADIHVMLGCGSAQILRVLLAISETLNADNNRKSLNTVINFDQFNVYKYSIHRIRYAIST